MYSSTPALDGVVGQRNTPVALLPEKDPVPIVQDVRWGSRPG
jgi:hypothetical protein